MTRFLWLLPLSFILYACPFESNVPLEKAPVEPIDSSLLGYWYGIIKDGSDFFGIEALEISRQSDSVYAIIRYGKAVKGDIILPDTAYYTGFSTRIGEQSFMSIQAPAPDGQAGNVYYLAAFGFNQDTMQVKTITETFTTRKYFSRPEELKKLLSDRLSQRTIYDDLFTLSYRKIPKPARFQP